MREPEGGARLLEPTGRITVTGACGWLGTHIVEMLLARGVAVTGVDKFAPKFEPDNKFYRHIVADLRDKDNLTQAVEGAEIVIHTAALHGYHLKYMSKEELLFNNIMSDNNLFEISIEHGVKHIVFTSSTSIYGLSKRERREAIWVDEQLDPRPDDIYDLTKMLSEEHLQISCQKHPIGVIALRATRFFRDDDLNYNLLKLYRGVDVRDVAEAHVLAAFARLPTGFEAYNIAAHCPFKKSDCAGLYRNAPSVVENYFPGAGQMLARMNATMPESIDRIFDISKAREHLGYVPKHNFRDYYNLKMREMS